MINYLYEFKSLHFLPLSYTPLWLGTFTFRISMRWMLHRSTLFNFIGCTVCRIIMTHQVIVVWDIDRWSNDMCSL